MATRKNSQPTVLHQTAGLDSFKRPDAEHGTADLSVGKRNTAMEPTGDSLNSLTGTSLPKGPFGGGMKGDTLKGAP